MNLKIKLKENFDELKTNHYLLNNDKVVDSDGNEIADINSESVKKFFSIHKKQVYPVKFLDENTIKVITFIEVTGKSEFSLQDSIASVSKIIDKAEVAIGITDHSVGYSWYQFNTKMLSLGKKPILGVEFYIKEDGEQNHLTVIAKNEEGYKTLSRLLTLASSRLSASEFDDPKARPWITCDDFYNTENLILLTSWEESKIKKLLKENKVSESTKYLEKLKSIFSEEDVYLEVQLHSLEDEDLSELVEEVGRKSNTKIVLTNDYHTIEKNDLDALEVFQAIGMKQTVDGNNWHLTGDNWYIHTSDEVEEMDLPMLWTDNTIEIFNKVEAFSLQRKENYMPKFNIPKAFKNEVEYFEFLANQGLKVRLETITPEYSERLKEEIDIIESMGFTGYFLIVADFINYSKRNYKTADKETVERWKDFLKRNNYSEKPIAMGPARGSVAGSLVAWSMGITDIDPLKYGLLFERFLNPERVSMPDVDADMPDNKRQEIIHYVKDYYNITDDRVETRVAGIGTFGTFKIKALLKAIVRVLWKDVAFGNLLASFVDESKTGDKTTWDEYVKLEAVKKLFSSPDTANKMNKIAKLAPKLIGLASNLTQHAAGYVIAPDSVTNFLPTTFAKNTKTGEMEMLTAYTYVEDSGLLKMDFLGLRTMAIIDDAITTINESEGTNYTVSEILDKAPTDLNLYKFIEKGNTGDLFQLSSSGMTDVVVRSLADVNQDGAIDKANNSTFFNRIIAGIAMYRPGPMAYIDEFVDNALNPENIEYTIPEMKDVLETSFGLMIYQESIMSLLRIVAGFSLGGADIARRAISKKKLDVLEEQKDIFIFGDDKTPGGLALGHSKEQLEELWKDVETFANYGFNKSHAAGYAHVVIIQAWLSYYYPAHFAVSNLNHPQNKDSISNLLSIYQSRNINTIPASVQSAEDDFTVSGKDIQFGLSGIKTLAKKALSIKDERETRGEFLDFKDFITRMARNQICSPLNKGTFEALIYSGALDVFSKTRKEKLDNISKISELFSLLKKESETIFDKTDSTFFDNFLSGDGSELDRETLLNKEKEYTGFYISGHPVVDYKAKYPNSKNYTLIKDITPKTDKVKIAAVIKSVHKILTKKGDAMAFVTIEDETSSIEVVVFPNLYKDVSNLIVENQLLILYGDVDGSKIIAASIEKEPPVSLKPKQLNISLPKSVTKSRKILTLLENFESNINKEDETIGVVTFRNDNKTIINNKSKSNFKNNWKINLNVSNLDEINWLVGENNITTTWITEEETPKTIIKPFDLDSL